MIEIEGVKYEQPASPRRRIGSAGMMGLMMAMMSMGGSNTYNRERPLVEIAAEYALIIQKKSKLSRNDRDWVVRMFKNNYQVVKEPTTPEELKGIKGGKCNRTACQQPGAVYYNHSTCKYYCRKCATMINDMNPESHQIYGHELCTLEYE